MKDLVTFYYMCAGAFFLWSMARLISLVLDSWFPKVKPAISKFISNRSAYWILLLGPFFVSFLGSALFLNKVDSPEVQAGVFATAASLSVAAFFEVQRIQKEERTEQHKIEHKKIELKQVSSNICIVLNLMKKRIEGQIEIMNRCIDQINNAQKGKMTGNGFLSFPGADFSMSDIGDSLIDVIVRDLSEKTFESFISASSDFKTTQMLLQYWEHQTLERLTAGQTLGNDLKEEFEKCLEKLDDTLKSLEISYNNIKMDNHI